MKVFSKEKFIELEGREVYESSRKLLGSCWVDKCDGKEVTNFEDFGFVGKIGECKGEFTNYKIKEKWCVEKEDKKEDKKEEESMKEIKEIEIEMSSIEDKVKDAKAVILCSDKGTYLNGHGMELLMVFSEIVSALKKSGVPEMFLQTAFEIGLEGMPKLEDLLKESGKSEKELKEDLTNKLDLLADLIKGLK